MPANKKVNLESLITQEELEQFNDIRVEELPEKIEKLGQGGFGQVFLYKFKDERLYAGKKPYINLFNNSPEDEKQMKKHLISALGEIKILHQLSHERIIKVFGFYLDQDQIIIFMEQMSGSVKNEINEKKSLSEIVAMHYFTQAAEGLVYLHDQKPKAIIHRDIKSENLLLTPQYNIKLADFGLATDLALTNSLRTDHLNAPSSIAGTYCFIAPEVIRTIRTPEAYGRKSDVWSLACALIEMISGQPPYKDVNFIDFVERSSNTSQNPLKFSGDILLPAASFAVRELLNSLFTFDYQLRPTAKSVLDLAHNAATNIKNAISDASEHYKIGDMYRIGQGVPQSDEEAVKWYRKAVEQGFARGQNSLGLMYMNGRGVPQSDEEAVKWIKKAVKQGDPRGQNNLGVMYYKGRGVSQSDEEAVKWYRKAAEQGNAEGQSNLGFMYRNGRGVPQSNEEAVKLFRKAAEQGNAEGQSNLGFMYRNGRGVPQSNEEAVKLFRKAAEQGDAEGQKNLGFLYEKGRGVPQSNEEAVKWYTKAAEQGNADAVKNLKDLQKKGQGFFNQLFRSLKT